MAIRRRTETAVLEVPVQTPASQRPFKPDPRAKLTDLPGGATRTDAWMAYDIGVDPKTVPVDDLIAVVRIPENDANVDRAYRNRIRSRLTAIRAMCVLCMGGSPKRVRSCSDTQCPLWAFRMGNNGFRRQKYTRTPTGFAKRLPIKGAKK